MITRKIQPTLPLTTWLVEALRVLLFGIRLPLWVAAEWRFGITNQLGDVRVDLCSVDWIVGEIPMLGKWLTVARVQLLIR